jgi:hypothetical protein
MGAQRSDDARRSMRAALETSGWTADSRVAMLADGADGLTSLVEAATSGATAAIVTNSPMFEPCPDRLNRLRSVHGFAVYGSPVVTMEERK